MDAVLAAVSAGEEVRLLARAALRRLAEVEACVHGVELAQVHFHELAGWDTVVDLLLAAFLARRTGATSWSVGGLPLGGGRVATQHGLLPVPAPATAALLAGYRFVDDGIPGERVTPTGAAILAALEPVPAMTTGALVASGHGFGTRTLPGISNCTRVLAFRAVDAPSSDAVATLAFEVDDQAAEDLATALERIRGDGDVLDVASWPVMGKKGRLATHVQVLARPAGASRVAGLCFTETTTIGIRIGQSDRIILPRHAETVSVGGHDVRLKVATLPDGSRRAKPEQDDLAHGDRLQREQLRRAALDQLGPRAP
jgi:hypothetical protein